MINERDEEGVRQLRVKSQHPQAHNSRNSGKLAAQSWSSQEQQLKQEELLYEKQALEEGAPETLRDIFKISNRNRKRNKQKKKGRNGGGLGGGSDMSSDYSDGGSTNGSSNNGSGGNAAGRDRESAFSIIANQYKQDISEGKSSARDFKTVVTDIKNLDDLDFMRSIGMIGEQRYR